MVRRIIAFLLGVVILGFSVAPYAAAASSSRQYAAVDLWDYIADFLSPDDDVNQFGGGSGHGGGAGRRMDGDSYKAWSDCNRFSLCLAAVSFLSATYCLCLSFSNSSLMGNISFLIMGKTKATNFLRLIAVCLVIIKLFCYESVKALRSDFPVRLRHVLHCFYKHISCIYHILCQTPIIRNRN